jgi:hypothetical protein
LKSVVWGSVWEPVMSFVCGSLWIFRNSMNKSVYHSIWNAVENSTGNIIEDEVKSKVFEKATSIVQSLNENKEV